MTVIPVSWLLLVGLGIIIAAELAYIAHEAPQRAEVTFVVPTPQVTIDTASVRALATFDRRPLPAEVCP